MPLNKADIDHLVDSRPFAGLSPDRVQAAMGALGFETDGRLLELNSYENRVYQLGHAGGWWVAKFYRPGRWTDAAILEEHDFARELSAADLPIAVPIARAGTTLFHMPDSSYRFSIFPFIAARSIEINSTQDLEFLGRSIGRLHAVGARGRFHDRPVFTVARFGAHAREAVINSGMFSDVMNDPDLGDKYAQVSLALLESIEHSLPACDPSFIRIHGDCHLGNILINSEGPVFVDTDDCMTGPRVQDLWMLLSGSPDSQRAQWESLMRGYEQFHHIDAFEWDLVEVLRALRMLYFAGWVAARWEDPAFPSAFPWYVSPRYWQDHISDLWLQCELIQGARYGNK